MLSQILREIEQNEGAISLAKLSQKLMIQTSTLEGMLQTLIGMGRIKVDNVESVGACIPGGCASCNSDQQCPLVVHLPKTYSVVKRN